MQKVKEAVTVNRPEEVKTGVTATVQAMVITEENHQADLMQKDQANHSRHQDQEAVAVLKKEEDHPDIAKIRVIVLDKVQVKRLITSKN